MGRRAGVQSRVRQAPPLTEAVVVPDDDVEDATAVAGELDDDLAPDVAASDNVGEQSIEINVEGLIAELEAESRHNGKADTSCARRKLEDYLERRRIAHAIEDFEDFEV